MSELLQFLFSGVTVGAVYALVALGFTIIYNASDVVNFAQGEFVMLGGMITFVAYTAGVPLPLAALIAIVVTAAVGVAMNKLTIEPARGAPVVSLIIITIGASIFIRGVAQIVFGKQIHTFPAFSGDEPIRVLGATILPQSLWVIGGAVAVFIGLWIFFTRTLTGVCRAGNVEQSARRATGRHQHEIHHDAVVRLVGGDRRPGRGSGHADHADLLRCRFGVGPERVCRCDARRHGQPERCAGRRPSARPAGGANRRIPLVAIQGRGGVHRHSGCSVLHAAGPVRPQVDGRV